MIGCPLQAQAQLAERVTSALSLSRLSKLLSSLNAAAARQVQQQPQQQAQQQVKQQARANQYAAVQLS